MKPKNFVLVTLLVVLAAVFVWWLLKPPAVSAENPAQLQTPIKANAPTQVAQVELPKLPPATAKNDSTSSSDALTETNPRTKPNTAITDAIRLVEDKDMVGFVKAVFPPNILAKLPPADSIERLGQDMGSPRIRDALLKDLAALKAIQDQTPILTDDGKTATFETHLDDPLRTEVILKKVDGLWYIENF